MDNREAKSFHRRDQRYPTSIPATIVVDREEYVADIKDISGLGCCIHCIPLLRKGEEVVIGIGGSSIVATIAWRKGLLAGANFHREIDPLAFVRDHSDHILFARRRLSNAMMAMAG